MKLIVFIITYPILWLISILPFPILYGLSDLLFYLIYYIIRYRRKAVFHNLQLAFPNKTERELALISKKSYRHFVDIFMEMIKTFSISEKELNKRYVYTNTEIIDALYKDGKSAILLGSHYANWEWLIGLNKFINYKSYAAFTKIGNKYLNKRILNSRERFGVHLIVSSKVIAEIDYNHQNGIQAMYGLLSDQSPMLKKTFHWGNFMGIKVPVHTGGEMLAKKYDLNVVVVKTKKIKRGFYENTFQIITDNANAFKDYEISDLYLREVEQLIYAEPAYYFWTHKRFKHKNSFPNKF